MKPDKLTGHDAIAAKELDASVVLCKYNDPIESARDNISIEDARGIAREDPSLIYTAPDLLTERDALRRELAAQAAIIARDTATIANLRDALRLCADALAQATEQVHAECVRAEQASWVVAETHEPAGA